MKRIILAAFLIALFVTPRQDLLAHCEVPCGIYHDELRFELIDEHIQTIAKSMAKIVELSADETVNYNQVVRWVNTKEAHADKIQEIVKQYFLTQRIKIAAPDDEEKYEFYLSSLKYLHEVLVYSMKCKQGTDEENVKKLQASADSFKKLYLDAHEKSHKK